jgi:hypothetical protein
MKQLKIALITLLLSAATATAQGTVEKSLFNFQTGTVGFWGSHEARLGNAFALRSEIGFDLWLYETYNDKTGSALVPSISLEPRWYTILPIVLVKAKILLRTVQTFSALM